MLTQRRANGGTARPERNRGLGETSSENPSHTTGHAGPHPAVGTVEVRAVESSRRAAWALCSTVATVRFSLHRTRRLHRSVPHASPAFAGI